MQAPFRSLLQHSRGASILVNYRKERSRPSSTREARRFVLSRRQATSEAIRPAPATNRRAGKLHHAQENAISLFIALRFRAHLSNHFAPTRILLFNRVQPTGSSSRAIALRAVGYSGVGAYC
jgi:hypothetical protein